MENKIAEKLREYKPFIEKANTIGSRIAIIICKVTQEILFVFDIQNLTPAEGGAEEFTVKGIEITDIMKTISLQNNQIDSVFVSEYEQRKAVTKSQEIKFQKDGFTYLVFTQRYK